MMLDPIYKRLVLKISGKHWLETRVMVLIQKFLI